MHYVKMAFTNCYLLPCKGGYLQIDVSYPDKYTMFVEELRKINIELAEIKYLLITHPHDDHAGFAAEFVKKTGVRLVVHERALPGLGRGTHAGTARPVNKRVKVAVSFFAFRHEFTFPPITPTDKDYIVTGDESDLLKEFGINGKILWTPGHSSDSMSVVLSDGSAFVGDAAMNFMNICGIKHRPIMIENIHEVYRTWELLKRHGAKVIYPSHGSPFNVEELVPVR